MNLGWAVQGSAFRVEQFLIGVDPEPLNVEP